MKRFTYLALAVSFGVLISNVVPAQSATEVKTIKACVNKKTTELRISSKCKAGETFLTWNASGERGEKGEKGDSGPSGASVSSAPRMVVLDGNGAFVGYPLGRSLYQDGSQNLGFNSDFSSMDIFMPSLSKVVSLRTSGLPTEEAIYFESSDCSGPPVGYVLLPVPSPRPLLAQNHGRVTTWYEYETSLGQRLVQMRSLKPSGSEPCTVRNFGTGEAGIEAFTLREVTAPFTNPASPLRITVQ